VVRRWLAGEEVEHVQAAVVVGLAVEEVVPAAEVHGPAAVCRGQAAAPCRGQVAACRDRVAPVECLDQVAEVQVASVAAAPCGRHWPAIIVLRWAMLAAGSAPILEMLAVVSARILAMRRAPRWAASADPVDRAA